MTSRIAGPEKTGGKSMERRHSQELSSFKKVLLLFTCGTLLAVCQAGTSINLSAVFPAWDEVDRGPVHEAVVDLARDYALQVGMSCFMPEVFVNDGVSTIITAEVMYETFLPFNATEQVLLETFDQRVSLVTKSFGGEALVVMLATSEATLMVICQ